MMRKSEAWYCGTSAMTWLMFWMISRTKPVMMTAIASREIRKRTGPGNSLPTTGSISMRRASATTM